MAETQTSADIICATCRNPIKNKNCIVCIGRVKEARKAQARIKARTGFSNHVRGIEKLMLLKGKVPTKYLKKDD